jgi:type I restriction enzyme M protein
MSDVQRVWIVGLSELIARKRFDAEHFDPKYTQLLLDIACEGDDEALGDIASSIGRGRQPQYKDDGEAIVVKTRNVGPQFLDLATADRTSREFFDRHEAAQVRQGDIVLNSTGVGSVGRANCVMESGLMVADNHVTIIRVDPQVCDPAYLAAFLNSSLGRLQTDQWVTGSSGQIELREEAIAAFRVRKPAPEIQRKIGDAVRDAHAARAEATHLMDGVDEAVKAR